MWKILDKKYEACSEFRDTLHQSGNKILAEATGNRFWSTGLPPKYTALQSIDI
jgi:predicted NAD-dependent protein-ADP-ribosyltransferase YbiA (DUF1768 family)